jgi:uncharacterized protein (DUF885 family)
MRKTIPGLLLLALLLVVAPAARADDLDNLAGDFWEWRARTQPLSGDDVDRIVRPDGWTPDWSPEVIAQERQALADFSARWKKMDPSGWPAARQVDYRLVGSALARVHWELNVLRNWQRNPRFYVSQTLGAVFEELLAPPPFDKTRSANMIKRLESIPAIIAAAKANLTDARRPFAQPVITFLEDVRPRLETVARELKPLLAPDSAAQLDGAVDEAATALEGYRAWLAERLPEMPEETSVGRDAYVFFLKDVALLPFTPEEIVRMGREEWERAVAFEAYEKQRNRKLPALALFPNLEAQLEREKQEELAVRRFLEEKGILTVPAWVRHYRTAPMPTYLAPLAGLGVTAWHTTPTQLNEDGVSYRPPPSPTLSYFYLATAHDPCPLLVHEGVPGHYFHLVLSWKHPDPIRRHYYDSGPIEGLAFYAEEMLLQAGLFDDSPRTREIIYNFMRLRALRVEVDVKLATGEFSVAQAADYLEKTVPMDARTARGEAAFFAATPGQAISYQIGKLQIWRFLAAARRAEVEDFDLRAFHDRLWQNANVPLALQEWEYFQRSGGKEGSEAEPH